MIKHSQKSYSSLSCGTERTEQNQKKKKKKHPKLSRYLVQAVLRQFQ